MIQVRFHGEHMAFDNCDWERVTVEIDDHEKSYVIELKSAESCYIYVDIADTPREFINESVLDEIRATLNLQTQPIVRWE